MLEPAPRARRSTRPDGQGPYMTIGDVARELGVGTHVLRYWEGKFEALRPVQRAGGRRYYRPEDVALARRIRTLLQDEGRTIAGAQRTLEVEGLLPPAVPGDASGASPEPVLVEAVAVKAASPEPERIDPSERAMIADALVAVRAALVRLRSTAV